MIKVCSLDFVNKETFEADIMTAEGGMLYSSEEKVTPDKILKLYFKEIYVNESQSLDVPEQTAKEEAKSTEAITKLVEEIAAAPTETEDTELAELKDSESTEVNDEAENIPEEPAVVELEEAVEPEPVSIETEEIEEVEEITPEPEAIEPEEIEEVEETAPEPEDIETEAPEEFEEATPEPAEIEPEEPEEVEEPTPEPEEIETEEPDETEEIVSEPIEVEPSEAEEAEEASLEPAAVTNEKTIDVVSEPFLVRQSEAEITEEISSSQEEAIIASEKPAAVDLGEAISAKSSEEAPKELVGAVKGPMSINAERTEHTTDDALKGPRLVESSSVETSDEATKGPVAANFEDKYGSSETKQPYATKAMDEPPAPVPEVVVDKNPPLKFNEEEAKKIVESSLKLGKMFNYSANELKELEQVAYYSNIGITNFRKDDLAKKDFLKMKILSSYQMLSENGKVSNNIAQIIKNCASNYESNSFPLNSQIPYYHIVTITGFYEDLLAVNESKTLTLMKMLQIGGNQFNIFVLHKFIKLMRDSDE